MRPSFDRSVETADLFDDPLPGSEVKAAAARGWMVTAASRGGTQLVQLAALPVLARLLAPADFGLVAMVGATIGIAELFRDMGLSSATMRAPKITRSQVNTLFWINALCGAAMMALVMAAAPYLAALLADPRVEGVALVMSCNFLLNGLAAQHFALLRRNLRFGVLARNNMLVVLLTTGVSLALALATRSYWALVIAALAGGLLASLLAWYSCAWRPRAPAFDPTVRPMISFGGYMVAFGVLSYLGQNLHGILIGRIYGAGSAGLYTRASTLLNTVVMGLLDPLAQVLPPALSRLGQESPLYREYYLRVIGLLVLAATPICLWTPGVAADLIAVVLGPRWQGADVVLFWLALGVLPRVLGFSTGWLYMSRGDSRGMMQWGMVGWSGLILGVMVGLQWGMTGVAVGYAVSMYVLLVPCLWYAVRSTSITLADIARASWRPVAAGILAWLPLTLLATWLAPLPPATRLCLSLLAYLAAYGGLLLGVMGQRAQLLQAWAHLRTATRSR